MAWREERLLDQAAQQDNLVLYLVYFYLVSYCRPACEGAY